ncbi:hypothetical protein [Henriciella litoralis]|uniref:hypothetical protein n=1 Tax=Henriciella litoralis TaxID=568102 RepID=UPI0009FBEDEB|nr:hypothetical protein [Henriciella litoralis]
MLNVRTLSRAHKLVGLVIGLQLLFWTASGLFFTLFPIEQIRGEHLRREPVPVDLTSLETLARPDVELAAQRVELRQVLDRPVWLVKGDGWSALYNVETGEQLSPLGEAAVRQIALSAWAGDGDIASVQRVTSPPREAFSTKPLWRVQFEGADNATFWVDAEEARVTAVRTAKWRVFDVLWRFHIMDVTGDDRFDSWWLKIAAFLGLTSVMLGIGLLIQRAMKGRLLK